MTSSSLVRTHQNGYPAPSSKVSQSDPYLQSFISRRPHVRTQHLRVTTTHANSSSSNFFQESFVVLVRLKSILLGPLCLRNSETLVD
ncbi:hypothetical protein QL285_081238 [Trifolium repens]|nr:hypothetical protein QL285_081238 [Trifolium repens]